MCERGTEVLVAVKIPADLSHDGTSYFKVVGIDGCIAPIVSALQKDGIDMRGSCCGHGKSDGEILLEDGRVLVIRHPGRTLVGPTPAERRRAESRAASVPQKLQAITDSHARATVMAMRSALGCLLVVALLAGCSGGAQARSNDNSIGNALKPYGRDTVNGVACYRMGSALSCVYVARYGKSMTRPDGSVGSDAPAHPSWP